MPYPRPFLRHTMVWSLPSGEIANIGVAWADTAGAVVNGDTIADELETKGLALWNAIKGAYAGVSYIGSRTAEISALGTTLSTFERSIAPVASTGGGNMLPHEVAVCASLLSAVYGRSGRGRVYLPPPAYGALTTTGRLDATIRGTMATAMATYCADTTDQSLFAAVASRTTTAIHRVLTVKVGDVFDSQRRRRDALSEVYTSATV